MCIRDRPEAADGGPIALIEEDDLIEIDIPARILRIVGVRGEKKTADEIDAILDGRRKNWMPKPAKYTSGVLKIFSAPAVSPVSYTHLSIQGPGFKRRL